MNTPVREHPTVNADQQWPAQQKASEPRNAGWLRQSCVGVGADEVHFMKIDRRPLTTIGLLAGWLTVSLMAGGCSKPAMKDARLQPPGVEVFKAKAAGSDSRTFTGIVEARVQSDLGFRVAGKILERSVNLGSPTIRDDDAPADDSRSIGISRGGASSAR